MPNSPRLLSLAALTVLELPPVEMVACAEVAGYSHLGLRLLPATAEEPVYPVIGDTPMVREIARRLASTGVQVLDIEILRLKPTTDVTDYLPVLETGARLGARHVLVAGNDADQSRLAANFAALAALAKPLRLSLCIEPMPWTDVRDVPSALRIIERSAVNDAGVLIDAIHFDRAGHTPHNLANIPASRLPYVQLCDAPSERPHDTETLLHQARAERLMPGDGGLDLAGLLRALPRQIPISLEVPMRTLAKSVDARERARRIRTKTLALLDAQARTPIGIFR
ncbi:MAG TPA: TIM barrel protein [Casimicrobiaceae bacterium]|nr:TIM barrel protein [Casimicrobiaceae bacterium]